MAINEPNKANKPTQKEILQTSHSVRLTYQGGMIILIYSFRTKVEDNF